MGSHNLIKKKMIFLSLFLGMLLCACGKVEVTVPVYSDEVEPADEKSVFAVLSNVDEVNGKMTIQVIPYSEEITLSYNGGCDIQDKYGELLAASQLELGSIVNVVYDGNRDKMLSLHLSDEEGVTRMKEVSGSRIDLDNNTLTLGGVTYPLSRNVGVFSENVRIGLDEICSEDQLSLWFYEDEIYAIRVELGHGYVRLKDHGSYVGGMVEIGYDVIVPVTEDMLLTVREGEYTLRISKGEEVGTKPVKVIRNQELELSLADIAIEPEQTGSVLFDVTPSDAQVYIDGKRINTEGAVALTYGKHRINIVAEGYESYSASFNVNYAYKIKEYKLQPEEVTTQTNTAGNGNNSVSTTERSTAEGTTEAGTTENGTTESASTETTGADKVAQITGIQTNNKVTVASPTGASVYFDGEYIGVAPMSFTKVTGSHIITLSQLGYLSKSYTVTFSDDGKDETLQYDALTSITSLLE